jgi:hypothetical protein
MINLQCIIFGMLIYILTVWLQEFNIFTYFYKCKDTTITDIESKYKKVNPILLHT